MILEFISVLRIYLTICPSKKCLTFISFMLSSNSIYKEKYRYILSLIISLCINFIAYADYLQATTTSSDTTNKKVSNDQMHLMQNDSSYLLFQQQLQANKQIASHFFEIHDQLASIEESIRLMEIYNALQAQESVINQTNQLKKSIKTRSYIAMGAGLISSVFLLLNNDGQNDGLRYGGAALSFSLPIISFISMKKQINNLAPATEVDYSLLKDNSYPHNSSSLSYFQQTIKLQVFNLKSGILPFPKRLEALKKLPESELTYANLKKQALELDQIASAISNYFQYQYLETIAIINNAYFIFPFDNGTRQKLANLSIDLQERTAFWKAQQQNFKTNRSIYLPLFSTSQ